MTIISLDSGPLSLVTQRRGTAEGDACKQWLADHLALGTRVVVPEIVEYELRRELLRARKTAGVQRLEAFIAAEADRLIPLKRSAMLTGRGVVGGGTPEGVADGRPQGTGHRCRPVGPVAYRRF